MIYEGLKKNIGVVRRYSKMQFKKLLNNYLKTGLYENMGQNTILNIINYMDKKLNSYDLGYSGYDDMKKDLRDYVKYLNETLSKTNNRKNNYEIVSSELNNYIFFEGVDFEKYNF